MKQIVDTRKAAADAKQKEYFTTYKEALNAYKDMTGETTVLPKDLLAWAIDNYKTLSSAATARDAANESYLAALSKYQGPTAAQRGRDRSKLESANFKAGPT